MSHGGDPTAAETLAPRWERRTQEPHTPAVWLKGGKLPQLAFGKEGGIFPGLSSWSPLPQLCVHCE